MKRFSAPFLVSAFVLTACPADGGTTSVESTSDTTGTATTNSDSSGTTEAPTTVNPTTPTSTTEPTTEPTTTDSTTEAPTTANPTVSSTTTDPTTGTTAEDTTATSTTDDSTTTGGAGVCGDGVVEGEESCDDSNLVTELSTAKKTPLTYDASSCIDDCSLVLSLCGDGTVDPGEACDDGNQDSYDDCTTSCTVNDKSYHAPCKRMCNQNCDTDVTSGTFTGCDNMEVPDGAEPVCYVSTKFMLAKRYFAEGECATTAQVCDGGLCPPNVGDFDGLTECPADTTLVVRHTETFGVKVDTKVCQKTCESDSDCRWNAFDSVWGAAGQFRCQTTADSNGVKICADGQN